MAYLHCHDCDWGQDDFWSRDGYNPISILTGDDYCKDLLFKDKVHMDHNFFRENNLEDKMHEDEKGVWINGQNLLAWKLRRKARNVENMAVRTNEEWKQVKEKFTCPKCGSKNWDID